MKTNKFSSTLIGLGALALALSLNFVNASNDYGISDNSLSQQVLAQTNSSGSGSDSGSGSGSSSDGGSGSGTVKDGFYIIREVAAQPRTEVHCDGRTHTIRTHYGVNRTCEGKGVSACKEGWYPTSFITDPKFTNCPGQSVCEITNNFH